MIAVLADEVVLHAIAHVDGSSAYCVASVAHHHAMCVACGTVHEIASDHVKKGDRPDHLGHGLWQSDHQADGP
ncbi:transcriptional repressor [Mycolicibacterium iranicum]|uniref:transcriptional repressor n=1 Tax=Mycolicibacterium iranicum TaxID=912594 RepID=UPI0009ED8633